MYIFYVFHYNELDSNHTIFMQVKNRSVSVCVQKLSDREQTLFHLYPHGKGSLLGCRQTAQPAL